jgi:hypothetical protein
MEPIVGVVAGLAAESISAIFNRYFEFFAAARVTAIISN